MFLFLSVLMLDCRLVVTATVEPCLMLVFCDMAHVQQENTVPSCEGQTRSWMSVTAFQFFK